MMPVEEFMDLFDIKTLPDEDEPAYYTVGGFVLNQLGEIPRAADTLEWENFRFEIMDMDGKRMWDTQPKPIEKG